MALRELNLGTSANSGDGDNLRAAATKIKENFAEIYADDYVTSARIADDVALGGNPTTTTQSAGDNSTKIATTAYADNAVANAIDAAPAALDTLNELAASLGDDANFAATMTTSLAAKLSTDAGAVGTTNIADDAVTTAKITDANVTTAKIADDAVTADKLANSINTEIAANTAKVTNATHTGDVTGATALTIAADAVDGTKIADDSIDSEHYVDGSIDTAHIADDAVTADKLANSINSEIVANTAKTGITSGQASEITANTAKVTNATHTGDVTGSGALTIANDAVSHAKLENRYTASGSITTYTGAVTVDWSAATNFVMGSSLTGAIEFDFTNFKTGQVLTIHNLTGAQTITLDSNAATSETFNKLGGIDYDGSATNVLMIECISDSADAVFNYSVLTYVSDTTPS
jgi:hypothetical protein